MKRFLALLLSALTVLALTSFAYAEGDNEVAAWAAQRKKSMLVRPFDASWHLTLPQMPTLPSPRNLPS